MLGDLHPKWAVPETLGHAQTLIMRSALPGRAKHVLGALQSFAHANGTSCFPAVTTVAKRASVNRATVFRALHELEQLGVVHRRRTGRSTSEYTLRLECLPWNEGTPSWSYGARQPSSDGAPATALAAAGPPRSHSATSERDSPFASPSPASSPPSKQWGRGLRANEEGEREKEGEEENPRSVSQTATSARLGTSRTGLPTRLLPPADVAAVEVDASPAERHSLARRPSPQVVFAIDIAGREEIRAYRPARTRDREAALRWGRLRPRISDALTTGAIDTGGAGETTTAVTGRIWFPMQSFPGVLRPNLKCRNDLRFINFDYSMMHPWIAVHLSGDPRLREYVSKDDYVRLVADLGLELAEATNRAGKLMTARAQAKALVSSLSSMGGPSDVEKKLWDWGYQRMAGAGSKTCAAWRSTFSVLRRWQDDVVKEIRSDGRCRVWTPSGAAVEVFASDLKLDHRERVKFYSAPAVVMQKVESLVMRTGYALMLNEFPEVRTMDMNDGGLLQVLRSFWGDKRIADLLVRAPQLAVGMSIPVAMTDPNRHQFSWGSAEAKENVLIFG